MIPRPVADPTDHGSPDRRAAARRDLFATGFCVLFLELACIRWFASYVVFLQFFTNIVLLAAFVGMSIGCLRAGDPDDRWLRRFPVVAVAAISAALVVSWLYATQLGFAVDVAIPDRNVVFFGTEARNTDLASFVIPLESLVALFFVLVALLFVGPGWVLGRALDAEPNRLIAYACDISGSLTGVACFALASWLALPAEVWFAVAFAIVGWFLAARGWLGWWRAALLVAAAVLTSASLHGWLGASDVRWSPYYQLRHSERTGAIAVNNVGHQTMATAHEPGPPYALAQLLLRDVGTPPARVLMIGSGSGNDLAWSLLHDVEHIDAVEIDPVIQDIGRRHHPDRPYDDPRVEAFLDDGRHFLERTERRYDLVTYAVVDSLILHSSYSNIRLESYLFTEEAFEAIARVLDDDGVFVTYNYFRQGWIVQRIVGMAERAFGRRPIVLSLPTIERIADGTPLHGRMTIVIAGKTEAIERAFAEHDEFWVHPQHERSLAIDGFAPPADAAAQGFVPLRPADVVADDDIVPATDDWPFLYVRDPSLPGLYLRGVMLVGGCAFVLLWLMAPGRRLAFDGRMFFLGAGFLLLETRAVVQLALAFGSTWSVNAAVFFAVLLVVLAANAYVLRTPAVDLRRHYAALFVMLGAGALLPSDAFVGGNTATHLLGALFVMAPVFFAGVVFADSFRRSARPDRAFAANIAGAIAGGLAEYASMALGFRHVLLLAALVYAASMLRRGSPADPP